jgi:hypothetical protein
LTPVRVGVHGDVTDVETRESPAGSARPTFTTTEVLGVLLVAFNDIVADPPGWMLASGPRETATAGASVPAAATSLLATPPSSAAEAALVSAGPA